jgi:hypothetical protein
MNEQQSAVIAGSQLVQQTFISIGFSCCCLWFLSLVFCVCVRFLCSLTAALSQTTGSRQFTFTTDFQADSSYTMNLGDPINAQLSSDPTTLDQTTTYNLGERMWTLQCSSSYFPPSNPTLICMCSFVSALQITPSQVLLVCRSAGLRLSCLSARILVW